uniref:Reverse transcriptase domain-containing protein n=1 Tax=Brugia timori TaxID=42155 RepID=A0A0R3Q9H7_9BILA
LWKNEAFHTAIEFSIFVHKNQRPNDCEFEEVSEYHKANYENIKRRLCSVDWQTILRNEGNVEIAVDCFYNILYQIIHVEVPRKKKRRHGNSKYPVWYNRQIKNLKNRKQKAHKIYKKSNNNENLQKYLDICNELNFAIDTAFEEYNTKTENEIKSCPKNFFNYVKTNLKSDNFPSSMHLDEHVGNNSEEICNLFATFFQKIYTTFTEQDRDRDFFEFIPEFPMDINVNQVTVHDILHALKKLDASKGAGPDDIPPVFLKNLAMELTAPLFWIFKISLETGIFPKAWKSSFLVPIFKSGKKSDIRNYRGIAIISCIPKLFEAIINEKLFIQMKNRITNMQHGFYKGRSTATNLLEFINYSLNAMDNGNHVEALYTDFSKAFDRIDIPMLLFKLQKMGIEPGLLKWLESYLTNRHQIIKFNGKKSHPIQVTSGVPQGSHLGPLLFILYVNDISFILKTTKVLIYADDMKLFLEIRNNDDINIFQNEIHIFHTWCSKSLLQLNIKKCNSISFSRKRNTPNLSISLGNQNVEKCNRVRDLGVILDSKLNFNDHYNTIIHRANNMLSFTKRFSFNFNDPYTIKTLYVAYVRSILEYCSIVWSPFQTTHINRIESVQKQFLLYALRKLGWTTFPLPSYEARCMLINIQTLEQRRKIAMVSFVNDIVSQRIDSAEILSKLNFYIPSRQLRNRNLFLINHHRTNYAKNGPLNQIMTIYNQHCETI